MTRDHARAALAHCLVAAGVPVRQNLRLAPAGSEPLPLAVVFPGGLLAVDVADADALEPWVERVDTPRVLKLHVPEYALLGRDPEAVHMTLIAILSSARPQAAARYIRALTQLNVIARGRRRRLPEAAPLPCHRYLLRWRDVQDVVLGKPFVRLHAIQRRIAFEQRQYWRLLRREASCWPVEA
ncbi:MAG: hypothetical protein NZ518_08845 [Dehalococcoidia bacterium]|nr:hypothetical protein [Dehalococcoidia bacterium]